MNLQCPVRGCGRALVREATRVCCAHGHAFDIARSGYINLLQPQDRRSRHPGDTPEAVAARRRLHDLGVTAPLLDAIRKLLAPVSEDIILDAGCGEGFYLGNLAADVHRCGVDISVPAIEAAARRYSACEWIVANADRCIPYQDGSFSAAMSITARHNAGEFRRILREDGRLLIALPSPPDLIELRGKGRADRVSRTVAEFAAYFKLVEQGQVTTTAALDAGAVRDVMFSIYRPMSHADPIAMQVTFSLDLLLFHPLT